MKVVPAKGDDWRRRLVSGRVGGQEGGLNSHMQYGDCHLVARRVERDL
jgi:hypothetical protein